MRVAAEAVPRVLIVDDDPAMCEMLSDLLQASGLTAESVASSPPTAGISTTRASTRW